MGWITSTRIDDNDRLRIPAIPPPQSSGAEKKESGDRHLSRACQPLGKPFSILSYSRSLYAALTVSTSSPTPCRIKCQSSASVCFWDCAAKSRQASSGTSCTWKIDSGPSAPGERKSVPERLKWVDCYRKRTGSRGTWTNPLRGSGVWREVAP